MFNISPAVRVSFGLVMFTLSVILIADLFGIVPKKEIIMLDARKKVSEVLAVQLSVAVSKSEFDIVKSSLEYFVERNSDVVAASMTTIDGAVIHKFGKFINLTDSVVEDGSIESTDKVVVVPVFSGQERWGSVNVEFNSLYSGGFLSIISDSVLGILLFVSIGCFFGYLFILRKALKVLDPKGVVPERVRSAFNTLSEGVLIVDNKEQIIMANDAFAEKIDQEPEELLGVKASSFKWKHANKEVRESTKQMPWEHAIKEGVKKIGTALDLSTDNAGVRSLSANCAPIQDDNGNTRGALITFDDITDVQETNVLLENAVTNLTRNDAEIRRKNAELEVLATRDPLTGCYNRRAFFDLFDKMLEQANKQDLNLSCIMVDIDHFKLINDNFGHSIGDEAIRLIADILNNDSDDDALVGRYGGEEFCVILPGTDVDEAEEVAESIRLTIQSKSKDFCVKDFYITASLGVTYRTDNKNNSKQLLEQADTALYMAKESGRNRVVVWSPESVSSIDDELEENGHILNPVAEKNDVSGYKKKISILETTVNELQEKLTATSKTDDGEDAASIDPVTGLPSKLILLDRISQAIEYSGRNKKLVAVATLNVDMFSRINETMGWDIGDEFLREIGHRLKGILRSSDTVASMLTPGQSGPVFSRLKDDEFAILLPGLDDLETLTYVIKRIQNKFSGNVKVDDKKVFLTSSIGIAVFPQDGNTAESLIENSRRARIQAKLLVGRNNFQLYSQVDNRQVLNQMKTEIDLHNAIEEEQFVLYYQPKLDLKSDTISSIEALIRWQHPTKGLIFPNDFISHAEKTGMILEIGKWCLQSACKQTRRWVEMGATNIRTSVNVSMLEFSDADFKDNVISALKDANLNARHLEIEITESTIMADPPSAHKLINDLRFLGVTITLDDFGTGYSSLSYFGNLTLDWLKLDRSFLLQAMDSNRSRTIYTSIVKMVHATGVKVVSEGIETQAQYDYIRTLNVDEMQGYILSKPVDDDSMTSLLFPDSNKKLFSREA
ncbi:MAG: diguanylate cyclase [Gammaproteobacteria bacterium]|nr:diguanylate cyclase [Gammaproteobacteria bacterium]MBT8134635.1 diguanylate cyclase [Gammaproteobacteria bacterium]NNJ50872.1 diguanylate cyclase [Gammaproteobacteria bacterium]